MSALLEFDAVARRFGETAAAAGLDLRVDEGDVAALVGLNGAGKTTLLRLALGMLRPDHGTATIFGLGLDSLRPEQWRDVGALVGAPLAYPELTVGENLEMACRLREVPPGRIHAAVEEWGLGRLLDRRFAHLSLGNRQRVGLAAALLHEPRLVVLDEPSNALDPRAVIVLREHLARRAGDGAGVLVSSHHLDEVARVADHITVMHDGTIVGALEPGGVDLERRFFECVLGSTDPGVRP